MFRHTISRIGRIGIVTAALAGLASCGPAVKMSDEDLARGHQFKPAFQVENTTHRHLIPLNPADIDFVEQQRRDLYDFLVGVGAQPGDSVIVAARRARLDHRGEIVEFVRRMGLKPDLRLIKEPKPGAEDDGYDTAILIQFHRYVTRNPDWRVGKQVFDPILQHLPAGFRLLEYGGLAAAGGLSLESGGRRDT